MKLLPMAFTLAVLSLGTGVAGAATEHGRMHAGARQPGTVAQEYINAMNGMHGPMMRGVMDPDPDAAFARGMLWHHRGAVDMAEIELKYGKDPELKKLAEEIMKAQGPEITFLENWLKKKNLPE